MVLGAPRRLGRYGRELGHTHMYAEDHFNVSNSRRGHHSPTEPGTLSEHTRIVEDKHQVFSGTFGSFASDADMTRVVGAFIFHVLNGVFARRCGRAAVFVLFGGRSQRNERVSGNEHLNKSEQIGRIWVDLG